MCAVKLGDAFVALGIDDKAFDRGLATAKQKATGWVRDVGTGLLQGAGQAMFNGLTRIVGRGIDEIGKSVKVASDLNETVSKTGAVFRDSSKEILAWSQGTSTALGISQQSALGAASQLGNMFKQLGFGTDQAANFSKSLVETSADLVAFHNVSGGATEVLDAMQSAFRGEYDALQRYIPTITAATVEQQALADTGKESTKQLTAGEKAAATYAIILKDLGDAAGANARELGSAASQQRIFNSRVSEGAAQLGQILLPVQQAFYTGLNELMTTLAPYGTNIMRSLAGGLADGIIFVLPILAELRAVFVRLLKPGSPPKLLPELTDWGKGAMKAYIDGWLTADFDSLRQLGGTFESIIRSFAGSGDIKETDLVARVFGTQRGLTQAIKEFREVGSVSVTTLDSIRRSAGPAGESVTGLVQAYFNLENAAKGASAAQAQLDAVTRRYDEALSPFQKKLDALQGKQQEIRDEQRLGDLADIITDRTADVDDRRLARLEHEEILLRQQMSAIVDERDLALDAEQKKLDAANAEQAAKQELLAQQQAITDLQVANNGLIAEETALREQLIQKGLAEQARVLAELEAQQRKAEAAERDRLAGLEAISDAHFRMKFATSDTAGQLALWTEKMHQAEKGSVDFYDAVTQVWLLTKKLNEELAAAGPSGDDKTEETIQGITEAAEKWPEIVKVEEALKQVWATINGQDNQVSELTWGQGIIDGINNIVGAAQDAKSIVGDFINFFMDKPGDSSSTSDILRPTYNSGIFGLIYTGVTNILTTLRQIFTGDWQPLWNDFKQAISDALDMTNNPIVKAILTYIKDTLIPALEALGNGDWKKAWDIFMAPIEALASNAYDAGRDLMANWWQGVQDWTTENADEVTRSLDEWFKQRLPDWLVPDFYRPVPDTDGGQFGGGGGGGFGGPEESGGWLDWLQSNRGSAAPQLSPAGNLAGMGSTTNSHNVTTLGPFYITVTGNGGSPEDTGQRIGGGIDDELRRRGWSPT